MRRDHAIDAGRGERSSYRFVVEAVLFLTYAAFGLSWIAVTPLLGTLQREFHVGNAAIALLNTAVSVAKVIAPLATGALAVRFGLRRTILAGAICIAAAAGVALAPRFEVFVAGRFLFGLGGAVVVTLMAPMAMQWFARDELPIVNGVNNVAVNTGIALTIFATGPLASRLGRRGALAPNAALDVALAVAWALAAHHDGDGAAGDDAAPRQPDDGDDVQRGLRDLVGGAAARRVVAGSDRLVRAGAVRLGGGERAARAARLGCCRRRGRAGSGRRRPGRGRCRRRWVRAGSARLDATAPRW